MTRRTMMQGGAVMGAAGFLPSACGRALATSTAPAAVPAKPGILVELFTSQGCSSCPPADRAAAELAARDDVFVISFNVDYWDYLGWKDTLARPEFSKRQMNYAHRRGDGDVYTPQVVINGEAAVVGSRKADIVAAIDRVKPARVPITIETTASEVQVSLPNAETEGDATLWLMGIVPKVDVQITRGENAGSTITYHNVVRSLVPAGMWKGRPTQISMPRKAVMVEGCTRCLASLQVGMDGQVIGLAEANSGST